MFNRLHALALVTTMALGCAADADEPPEEGAQTQALGEASCATSGGYPYFEGTSPTAPTYKNGFTMSASSSYYSPFCSTVPARVWTHPYYSNPQCPNQYIFEVTDLRGQGVRVETPNFQTSSRSDDPTYCNGRLVAYALWARDVRRGGWTYLGKTYYLGQWRAATTGGFSSPARCEFSLASGSTPLPVLGPGHPYSAVRLTGFTLLAGFPSHDMSLGFQLGNGPC